MRKAVEQGSGHLGIAEDRGPFAEAEVCGDDHAGSLIEFAQEVEEHRSARRAERQVSELIKDHEIKLGQAFSKMSRFAFCFFHFKSIDQLNGREEAHLSTVMFHSLNPEGHAGGVLSARRRHAFCLCQDRQSARCSAPHP